MSSPGRFSHRAASLGRRCRPLMVGVVLILVAALGADAADFPDLPAVATAGTDSASVAAPGPASFGAEVAAVLAAEHDRVAELEDRFDSAPDEDTALAIQREIEGAKAATEIAILQIQARRAHLAGRSGDADRIKEAIRQLTAPMPVTQPTPRQAPTPGRGNDAR